MTRAFSPATRSFVELAPIDCNPACTDHPHCEVGHVMEYADGRLVCRDCSTDALADLKPAVD